MSGTRPVRDIFKSALNLFFFIEHLCFEYSIKTLHNEYKKEIPNDLQNRIKDKLLNKEKFNELLNKEKSDELLKKEKYNEFLDKEKLKEAITIKDLGAAVRRYISRYLAGTMQELEINEDRKLSEELGREDLWDERLSEDYDLLEINNKLLDEFNLTVGQAYEFYKLIGKEDEDLLKEYAIAKNENEENENEENDNGLLDEIL